MKSGDIPRFEREKIARDIHDLIGQPLTALKFMIARLDITSDKGVGILGEVRDIIDNLQVDVRKIITNLQAEDTPKKPVKKKTQSL